MRALVSLFAHGMRAGVMVHTYFQERFPPDTALHRGEDEASQ